MALAGFINCLALFSAGGGCVLALGRIGDRIDKSIYAQSRDLIAGDLVLRASYPVDENWLAEAKRMGLTLSRQMQFTTMSYAPEGDTHSIGVGKSRG